MADSIQAIRGMNDILPADTPYWQYIEKILREITNRYGYQEIRFPIVEQTQLFKRTIGEITDIVEKEMYTFADRNGDSLTLRPEGTAGCARAGIQNSLIYQGIQRLWYMGPMFRHERPQKGRYRQFHQFGVEVFGLQGPDIDAEIIFMCARLWEVLGIKDGVTLHLNNLGTLESRQRHHKDLIIYLTDNVEKLDDDSKNRLNKNPLRILDSKNPQLQDLISQAPSLLEYLDDASLKHFNALKNLLDQAGIAYVLNPLLVRGLDYYCLTAFEWITDKLGAQGTICGGGRYDILVEQIGGRPTHAVGFALGIERLVELVKAENNITNVPDVYLVLAGEKAQEHGMILAERLRSALPQLRLAVNCGGGNFKNQFKRADKSSAKLALILGEQEIENNVVTVKYLWEDQLQQSLTFPKLVEFLTKIFNWPQFAIKSHFK